MHAHDIDAEAPLTPSNVAEEQAATALRDERSLAVASNLISARLAGRFTIFDDVGEGKLLPDGTEETSGHVVDERGDHYYFWVDWDTDAGRPKLGTWVAEADIAGLEMSAEYRHARALVGLPPPVRPS